MNSANPEPNVRLAPDISDLATPASVERKPKIALVKKAASVAHQFSNAPALVQSDANEPINIDEKLASKPESTIPVYPLIALDGDYLGELAYALTNKTGVPMSMARANIKTIVGALLDGHVGFPGHEDLHMRHYSMQIAPPRCGKGESWKRTGAYSESALSCLFYAPLDDEPKRNLTIAEIKAIDQLVLKNGGTFGSGEFMIKSLAAYSGSGTRILARFDEMKSFFEKAATQCSTLESVFLSMYETCEASNGSFANGLHEVYDVRFSFSGDFTPEGFERTFAGRGGSSSGFLARCTLTYSDKKIHEGDWSDLDPMAVRAAVKKIQAALYHTRSKGSVWIPTEDSDARDRRIEFVNELRKSDDAKCAELEAHFKRDLLLHVAFGGNDRITLDKVKRSIAWTEYQLELRKELWPEDAGGPVERMERKIVAALEKKSPLSDRDLMRACHTSRPGNGGSTVYHCAKRALLATLVIREAGSKNRPGNPTYALAD